MSRRPVVLHLAVAIGVLVIGLLVYLFDRQPDSVYFIPKWIPQTFSLDPVFGQFGQHLPTFAHVFVFILLTITFVAQPLKRLALICLFWFTLDSLLEIAQITIIAQWVTAIVPAWFEGIPFLENIPSYFLLGTFDVLDLVSIALGAIAAYLTILISSSRAEDQQVKAHRINRPIFGYTYFFIISLALVGTVGSGGDSRTKKPPASPISKWDVSVWDDTDSKYEPPISSGTWDVTDYQ